MDQLSVVRSWSLGGLRAQTILVTTTCGHLSSYRCCRRCAYIWHLQPVFSTSDVWPGAEAADRCPLVEHRSRNPLAR